MSDPTSVAPMLLVPACVALIVGGVLIAMGKGPGASIKPHSRRRSARIQAQRKRVWIGIALAIVGLIGFCVTVAALSLLG